jgi:hypothetical protein
MAGAQNASRLPSRVDLFDRIIRMEKAALAAHVFTRDQATWQFERGAGRSWPGRGW